MKQSDNGSKSKTERDWTTTTTTTKTGKLQNMTRTAPRAISLENHKKEFQYEGRTRQVMEPEKRVRKMRSKRGKCCQERISPPQKNPKTQPSFSNDKMLTVREVRESRPTAKYFPVRLDLTQSISTYYHTFIQKRKYVNLSHVCLLL